MKNKLSVVLKKFQSYSFLIFLILVVGAFFVLSQLNNNDKKNNDPIPADNQNQDDDDDDSDTAIQVENEVFKLPMAVVAPTVIRDFYDMSATVEEQMKAIIEVDHSFFTNEGVDYQNSDATTFDVMVSLSGTVTKVKQDTLLGWIVEVDHLYGVKTVYNSLTSVNVAVGDQIDQGEVIGTAGENNFDPESGIHVHFEVTLDGSRLNPNDLIGTGISAFAEND